MINPISILVAELDKLDPKPTILYGTWEEISQQLAMSGISSVSPSGRYPAILIPIGYEYNYGDSIIHEVEVLKIPMYLIVDTAPNKSLTQRYETTYKNTLYPLAEKIEQRLLKSNKFDMSVTGMNNEIKKTVRELPFDTRTNKEQNKIKDIVDCLELTYDSLKIKNINI